MTFPETYHVTVLALSQLKGAQGHNARVAICIAPTMRHCGLKGRPGRGPKATKSCWTAGYKDWKGMGSASETEKGDEIE